MPLPATQLRVLTIVLIALSAYHLRAADWDIEAAPGPTIEQKIDVDEGTWISLDVSPDGKEIVFDLLGDIYLMPIEGAAGDTLKQQPKKLASGVAWDMQPRFSPDGQWIAFTSDRKGASGKAGDNIWIMDRSGKQVRQVTNETYRLLNGPSWSPDGQYIVARKHFSSRRSLGAGEMWLYHHDAVAANAIYGVQLTKKPTDQKDVNEPVFSPDGKYLYYSEDVWPGSTFEYDKDSTKQIYVVKRLELATGDTETYISGPGGACRPTPSPDGRWIAFVRRVGSKTGLHLFDTESGAVKLLYDELERDMQETWAIHGVYPAMAWLPGGKEIVFWAKGKIRRINIDSKTSQVIPFRISDRRKVTKALRQPIKVAPETFDVRVIRHAQPTDNGKSIVFQALGRIYVRSLEDLQAAPRRLTSQKDHFEFMPNVSRDGKYVVYATWNDDKLGSIRVASLGDDGENWLVTSAPGHYRDPVFSPDGKTIVYEKMGGGMLTSPLWSHETGLHAIGWKGGEPKLVSKRGFGARFGKRNNRVFYLQSDREKDSDNLGLHSVQLDGAEKRQHYVSDWATDYVVSPDGKWIAFVERFNVFLAPMIAAGGAIKVGPKASNLPVVKVSQQAGNWMQFSVDSRKLHWSLGPDFYTVNLEQAVSSSRSASAANEVEDHPKDNREDKPHDKLQGKEPKKKGEKNETPSNDTPLASSVSIGFKATHARPKGKVALIGGRLVTMNGEQIIDNGTIVIEGNRIVAVGPAKKVKVPADAVKIELKGRTVLPGFVDAHAHGPQASGGLTPQRNWVDYARLAFGVTTIHDPSNDTDAIFAASELTKAGLITAPRTFSTGTILYGATGSYKAEIDSLEDAKFHLYRMKAIGAFSVKSYNQPRRDQRQQVLAAARELDMMVVPEGGATFMHNMSMIVDGHTGIEHTLSVQTAYDDVYALWRNTGVGYTPTLCVAYGGISGEQYWYQVDELWRHPRLKAFLPPHVLEPRSRRRNISPDEDYNHIRVAEIAKRRVDDGGLVQAGGHGQLKGICTHWEMWSFVQGGMTPFEALRSGTLHGAKYLGLDGDLGSLNVGKLADIVVMERGADPLKNIRDSERIEYVIANGQVFDARRMNKWGDAAPRRPFFWETQGYGGVSAQLPVVRDCGCQRGGAMSWLKP